LKLLIYFNMKIKVAILGSTGSIGKSTLEVIRRNKKNFDIIFLSANNNFKELIKQAKEFNVQNVQINNNFFLNKVNKSLKKYRTKVYGNNIALNKIIRQKIDYSMASIVGIAGLQPTIDIIKVSKVVALANKETIICAWDIISKTVKKYKTKIVPVDSEHFSIMELTKNAKDHEIKEIIITASGGPFLKLPIKKLKKVKPSEAIKHPNWSMGKKISVDSANLMNKVFEVIEATKIFNFDKNKYKIVIHPQSYVHSIIRFKNGLTKMILYNSDMKIPISNILYNSKDNSLNEKNININYLNKMNFHKVDRKKFPSIKFIKKCLNLGHSTPTIVNASNEVLVDLFLKQKIGFLDIANNINKIFKDKEFKKYAKKKPKSVKDIKTVDNWARLKTMSMCVL